MYSSQGHLSSPSQPPFGLPDPLAANDTYFRQSESLFPQDDEDSNDPADGQPIGGPGELHLQPDLEELEQEIEGLGGGRFSSAQILEVQDIINEMYSKIQAKAQEWNWTTESLLCVGNVLIGTRE